MSSGHTAMSVRWSWLVNGRWNRGPLAKISKRVVCKPTADDRHEELTGCWKP